MVTPVRHVSNSLPGGYSEREPPDPIPNSEVKTLCADGSVPFGHVRVGHCQASQRETPGDPMVSVGFCFLTRCRSSAQNVYGARRRPRAFGHTSPAFEKRGS